MVIQPEGTGTSISEVIIQVNRAHRLPFHFASHSLTLMTSAVRNRFPHGIGHYPILGSFTPSFPQSLSCFTSAIGTTIVNVSACLYSTGLFQTTTIIFFARQAAKLPFLSQTCFIKRWLHVNCLQTPTWCPMASPCDLCVP